MTLGNSNDRDPPTHDPSMDVAPEPGGDAGAAEAAAAAENEGAAEVPATSGGVFAFWGPFKPIIELVREAQKDHPVAGLLLPLLAIVVVGTALFKAAEPYAGSFDAGRAVLLIVYVVLLAMTVVVVAGDMLLQPQGKPFILSRIVLLVTLVGIGAGASYIIETCKPSWLARWIVGPKIETCRSPIPPPVVEPPIVAGQVRNANDRQYFMAGATVVLQHSRTFRVKTVDTGDYRQSFPKNDVGQRITAWANMSGFKRGPEQEIELKPGLNNLTLLLSPDGSVRTAPKFQTLEIPQLSKASITKPGQRVAVSSDNIRVDSFNGQNLRYDIFYCQPPQGDAIQSKILSVQLQKVLQAQPNVGGVRVRIWPALGTAGYDIPGSLRSATVLINNREGLQPAYESLKRLWQPYLASGEIISPRPVNTKFAGYISLLVCRSANAGA